MTNYHLLARDIMQVEIASVRGEYSVEHAAHLMRLAGTRSLLVESGDGKNFGIITYSDIVYKVLAGGKDPAQVRVEDIAVQPILTVNHDLKVQEVAELFLRHQIGHAAVVDDYGLLVGFLSMTDLVTEVITEHE